MDNGLNTARAERWARLEELSVMFPSNRSLGARIPPGKGTGCLAAPLVSFPAFPAGCAGDEGWGWLSLPLTCRGSSLWPELPSGWEIRTRRFALRLGEVTCGIKLHNSESYKAGMFIAVPGARGIAPPNLHTKSRSMHLFITKLI